MDFRTEIKIKKQTLNIGYNNKTMFIGSCFAQNIGQKLIDYKFDAQGSPFGTIYNPMSVAGSLNRLINNNLFTHHDLFFFNNKWSSFYHHSNFSGIDKDGCLNLINKSFKQAHTYLKQANVLILTFGTAWVYKLSNGNIVNNCHKLPASNFTRSKLTVNQIVDTCADLFNNLLNFNNKLSIILTVSPIRHLGDGFEQNQLSKATLVLAVHQLVSQFKNVCYFPAYEIMLDDLRDYRFYADDMAHPNHLAVNYIWQKFTNTYFDASTNKTMLNIEQLKNAFNHKPFDKNSDGYIEFAKKQLLVISNLLKQYPHMDFTAETAKFGLYLS